MCSYDSDDQMTMFALNEPLDPCENSAKQNRKTQNTASLIAISYFHLDLSKEHVDLFGAHYWEMRPPWLENSAQLNTGVAPRVPIRCDLSSILERDPDQKYDLSPKACLGILRRAKERGKPLPEQLAWALMVQVGLLPMSVRTAEMRAYHINQRDEGIDLHGVSGALMATSNMQMQTFITGDPVAFAANQRDEVRDLHNLASALQAQPGMKQQTFIAGFSAGAGAKAGSIGFSETISPTLKGTASGNCMPSVLCLNDQGGSVMDCTEGIAGTLRAQEHGHQPLVYENHGIDARYTGPHTIAPTLSARAGTGGNNLPLVELESPEVFCITGNAIDRKPFNGGNGIGYQEDIAFTLTATDHHAVYSRQRVDVFQDSDVTSTESARQYKDATDLVYRQMDGPRLIRRLTPLECERLQGFPDGWTALPGASDSARYKALGNSVAIPCVEYIMRRIALFSGKK